MSFTIQCAGPGPHVPASGVLGTSDTPVTGMRCASQACVVPPDPTVANRDTLQQKAQAALTTNTNYLAIGSPTNAQVATQVQALTRECSAVIRLLLNQLDSTSGT